MSNAIGLRYAKALFELAKDANALDAVEKSLKEFSETLVASPELDGFLQSPLYKHDEQIAAISEISKKAKLDNLVANTLGLMAQNAASRKCQP